jgi:hypothetical protein
MPSWTAQVFQNEYLPDGATDVHAIVTVTSAGTGQAGESGGAAAEAIIIDCSGSMGAPQTKIVAARKAAAAAINEIADGTWFAVIAGVGLAEPVYPPSGMVQADQGTRAAASEAVSRLTPRGGTAIGQWLMTALDAFARTPATQRHAILLTDGKNEGESVAQLQAEVRAVTGQFQCDCRGVGADWDVTEVRRIATELLGTVGLIPSADQMQEEFEKLVRTAMGRGVASAALRVWAPQGAQVLFVRQVAPTVEDLTARRQVVNPLTGADPTGSWGDESRDYHVAVRLSAKGIGQEQLAARVQLAVGDQVVAQGLVKALWSSDDTLTTRINPAVAHYTGQAELAEAIQDGLAAKAAGDDETATAKLGRAVRLAAETGNDEATSRLRKVVEVEDPGTGTVRLRRSVDKLDEMALDTASTKTTRVKK